MFINSSKIILSANRLASRSVVYNESLKNIKELTLIGGRNVHTTAATSNYAAVAPELTLPNNIDAAESTRFSPQRSRDISANVTAMQAPMSTIDITADNSYALTTAQDSANYDPHVQSYDCFGAVSLNSAMQSNVPTPFGGMHKFSHLNMPGGQWSQEYKFTSQNLHSSHYRALRENARSDWASYDQDATIQNKGFLVNMMIQNKRSYCTKTAGEKPAANTPAEETLSKKDKLKRAFKDYGATVVVFHVGISLISLGGFYLLVQSGIDFMPLLEYFNLANSTLASKLTTGSTFVVAYGIHKIFAPVRISITLGATPFIVRYLRSKGILKVKSAIKK